MKQKTDLPAEERAMSPVRRGEWQAEAGNGKPITTQLFGVPISITSKSQALALIGEWLREYRSVIGSRLPASPELQRGESVIGSKSAGFQSAGPKPMNRKQTNLKQKTENRKLITGYPKIIVTPNPEIIVSAQSDPELMNALQEADLSIPDGIGVIWALHLIKNVKQGLGLEAGKSSLQTQARPPDFQRLSGLDLIESLIFDFPRTLLQGLSSKESPLKVMLVGGRPGVAQAAAKKLMKQGLGLEAGFPLPASKPNFLALSGPQNISNISRSENNRLIAQINSFQPDLLFVAFGHPRQEKWLTVNRYRLTAGVAMAVGGALDQIADPSLRPPAYINSIGLGWLYRLLRQPWRWRRQLALLKFVGMVVREKLKSSNSKIQMPNQFQSSKFKKI